jgi:histidinol dehydrogenase
MRVARLSELDPLDLDRLFHRHPVEYRRVKGDVRGILKAVSERGDMALREFTERFDGVRVQDFRVPEDEISTAWEAAPAGVRKALEGAARNIEAFHRRQLRAEWFVEEGGVEVGQVFRPLESVGCYIPGGRASYPSTVLMTVLPARVAGVERIACVTPPDEGGRVNPTTLAACAAAGVDEVYRVGGAQAIAALAYGTPSIPRVDKIVGPGNVYVTAAKRLVSDRVAIDSPAGPSEVLILADETADPEFLALDLLAQAEHDPLAYSLLVTPSEKLAEEVLDRLSREPRRRREVDAALERNGAIYLVETLEEGVDFTNRIAPEHLQIVTADPGSLLARIRNAGSIFLGPYTPVACGDYASGTNHVLPTGGFARTYSGLSVWDFLKSISVQRASREGLEGLAEIILPLAEAEGLHHHGESVRRRLERGG